MAEPCDVTRLEDCKRMVEKTLHRFGTIDILINNAGVAHSGTVVESDPDLCERMVRVNLLGVYYMTRSVLTPMMEQKRGHIVNMGSVAGIKYSPGYAIYSATKFAVRAFSEALRNEVQSHNIRVTLIQPGMTRTSLLYGFIPEGSSLPLEEEKLLRPEDVAEGIFFALTCPDRVALNELTLRSTWQER
jgi:NADP-dependent 3-hydroxy acid dehydrogenase YdfG